MLLEVKSRNTADKTLKSYNYCHTPSDSKSDVIPILMLAAEEHTRNVCQEMAESE